MVLLELSLSRIAARTELEYNFSLLERNRDLEEEELKQINKVAKITYVAHLAMINRVHMYEHLVEKMKEKKLSLHQKTRTLLKKSLRVTESL